MKEWFRTTIGQQVTLQRGVDLEPARRRDGPYPVISSSGVFAWHDRRAASGPGVLLGRKGTIGTVHYSSGDYWPYSTCLWVKDFHGNDARFVYYFFLSISRLLASMDVGSANPTLNRNHVHPIAVMWPPSISEQRSIASTLGALDDKIASNERLAATVGDYLDALSEKLRGLPTTPLGTLAEASRQVVKPDAMVGEVEHFSIPAFDSWGMPDLTAPGSIKSGKFAVKGPRILVSRLNPRIRRVWYAVPSSSVALSSTEFLVLEGRVPCPLAAVWLAVTSESFSSEMTQRATGTSGSHQRIPATDALALPVPDMRLAEPALIDEAGDLLRTGHQAKVESAALRSLRDAVLPQLLTGHIRVPEVRDRIGAHP